MLLFVFWWTGGGTLCLNPALVNWMRDFMSESCFLSNWSSSDRKGSIEICMKFAEFWTQCRTLSNITTMWKCMFMSWSCCKLDIILYSDELFLLSRMVTKAHQVADLEFFFASSEVAPPEDNFWIIQLNCLLVSVPVPDDGDTAFPWAGPPQPLLIVGCSTGHCIVCEEQQDACSPSYEWASEQGKDTPVTVGGSTWVQRWPTGWEFFAVVLSHIQMSPWCCGQRLCVDKPQEWAAGIMCSTVWSDWCNHRSECVDSTEAKESCYCPVFSRWEGSESSWICWHAVHPDCNSQPDASNGKTASRVHQVHTVETCRVWHHTHKGKWANHWPKASDVCWGFDGAKCGPEEFWWSGWCRWEHWHFCMWSSSESGSASGSNSFTKSVIPSPVKSKSTVVTAAASSTSRPTKHPVKKETEHSFTTEPAWKRSWPEAQPGQCPRCDWPVSSVSAFKKHAAEFHPELLYFCNCAGCYAAYHTAQGMCTHVKKHFAAEGLPTPWHTSHSCHQHHCNQQHVQWAAPAADRTSPVSTVSVHSAIQIHWRPTWQFCMQKATKCQSLITVTCARRVFHTGVACTITCTMLSVRKLWSWSRLLDEAPRSRWTVFWLCTLDLSSLDDDGVWGLLVNTCTPEFSSLHDDGLISNCVQVLLVQTCTLEFSSLDDDGLFRWFEPWSIHYV